VLAAASRLHRCRLRQFSQPIVSIAGNSGLLGIVSNSFCSDFNRGCTEDGRSLSPGRQYPPKIAQLIGISSTCRIRREAPESTTFGILIAPAFTPAKTALYRNCNNSLVAIAAHANDRLGSGWAIIIMPARRIHFLQDGLHAPDGVRR